MSHAATAPENEKVTIQQLEISAYKVPTDAPEADGTLNWNSTTMVLVKLQAGGLNALGYTYADASAAFFIEKNLKPLVIGQNALDIPFLWAAMVKAIRNNGNHGLAAMAVAAVDNALWDLKAKLLGLPLVKLLGMARNEVPVYASGGFTSYSLQKLERQLGGWADEGFTRIKMKIGQHPEEDIKRVQLARKSVGSAELYVDANGAYTVKQALQKAEIFAAMGVTWFEEPVSSENTDGLRFIRQHAPAAITIAAGEYACSPNDFLLLLKNHAVDVLQADATRCAGITGFLKAAALAETYQIPFSYHCAPSLHLHPAAAAGTFMVGEYFHDHSRIEHLFFDGAVIPKKGTMKPDLSRPGLGLELKEKDAARYLIT